jgi:hypothetical protein
MISEYAVEEVDSVLYGNLQGRKPIRAISYGKAMNWFPRANEGNKWSREELEDGVKYGVWGGTVEGYGRGFNQQKVWLHFVGVDIDHKNGENSGWTPNALRAGVLEAVGDVCSVRTSSSGAGYHLFMCFAPVECANKATAQRLASQLGKKYILPRLDAAKIKADKVACNQLWVLGGKQQWLSYAPKIRPTAEDLVVEEVTASVPGDVGFDGVFGECAQGFLNLLAKHGAAQPLTHLTLIKRAVAGTEYEQFFAPYESGNKLDEPNTGICVINGTLRVYSFRHEKTLLSLPVNL